ncbi:protein jim lovell-like isoform X2 [Neocloeon triangulifer]|uniref:protein jim lovell-like isoform X2 n=1 Tax=Neocloeon triangulifer TaxID=2078957 RepID=UPI00286F5B96|nr:protein jim lovell-like isoform X2 [Neocloeon triangulifer]
MSSAEVCAPGYSLRWNNHQYHILNALDALLQDEAFVDVTLVCDEGRVRAHRIVLSACSPYFQRILLETPCKHPVIVLKDLKEWEVQAIVDFMYKGEISVSQAQLSSLIRAAESLQIRGLAHMEKEPQSLGSHEESMEAATPNSPTFLPGPFAGARGPENGPLLLSSPFSPSPAPHFEPPVKQSPLSEASSPPRDHHRVSPVPRRKQARPRRRSGEMARDLKKQPSRPPSPDLPENLSIKKTSSSEKVNALLLPATENCPAPSTLHSAPASGAPESPLTSADLPPSKAPSSLPTDLAPSERLLDFSMGGSPHALGLPDAQLDTAGFPVLPTVSSLPLTPPHMFSMESAHLGLFPPIDARNHLLHDLPEPRHDNPLMNKRKFRPKGQHSAPRGGPPRSWTNAELTEALQHVWNKKMTTSQASRIFGIPYNSLLMYVRGKYGKSLKLEQLKKDCLVGAAELVSPPAKAADEPCANNNPPDTTDLNFNPYTNFYSDLAFPIPVSMIHLLPQSEKNRELAAEHAALDLVTQLVDAPKKHSI